MLNLREIKLRLSWIIIAIFDVTKDRVGRLLFTVEDGEWGIYLEENYPETVNFISLPSENKYIRSISEIRFEKSYRRMNKKIGLYDAFRNVKYVLMLIGQLFFFENYL